MFSSGTFSRSDKRQKAGAGDRGAFLDRLKAGDQNAFSELVEEKSGIVFHLAIRMVWDRVLAEDITQEVFVKAYRGLADFKVRSSLSTWLYRIAYNTVVSEMEKARYRYETTDMDDLDSRGTSNEAASDLLDAIDRSETVSRLNRLIEELKPEQKWTMTLYYMDNKTYEEISEIMGVPMGTVKTYLFRAKQELRKRLRDREMK